MATVINNVIRVAAATLGAGALVAAAAGTASAWPTPITPDQQRYITQARAAGFPGDDDAVLQAGLQACRALYTGQGVQGAIGTVAGPSRSDSGSGRRGGAPRQRQPLHAGTRLKTLPHHRRGGNSNTSQ
jgi:hypothetical protein